MTTCFDRILLYPWAALMAALIHFTAETSAAEDLQWLAYGDIRGYLEPCGCDPESDLGGIRRLKVYLDANRGPKTQTFDLGNWLPGDEKEAKRKAAFLFEAAQELKPSARLLNDQEIIRRELVAKSVPDRKAWQQSTVLSNGRDASFASLSKQYTVAGSSIVFGYTYKESLAALLSPWSNTLLKSWSKTLSHSEAEHSVLLFSGPEAHLQAIHRTGLFDVIISASNLPMNHIADPAKDRDVATIIRLHTDADVLYQVPVAGQGILLGGAPAAEKIPELNLGGEQITQQVNPLTFSDSQLVAWLDRSFESPKPFKDLFARYGAGQAQAFRAGEAKRLEAFKDTNYVGSDKCAGCHPQAFASWKASAHATAMHTLVKTGNNEDGDCVKCHVVGWDKGGYVSAKHTPHLAGVQCENCHGPRKEHILNPTVRIPSDPRNCGESCHHPPHTSVFAYEEFWKRIAHGKERSD